MAEWDLFIAHSTAGKETALALFHSTGLQGSKTFLDEVCIPPGSDWDEVTQKAQSHSLITVVLLSADSRQSHYIREEVHTALRMTRRNPACHRIIPVYLDGKPSEPEDFLYGLGLIQGIELRQSGGVDGLARFLSGEIARMRSACGLQTADQPHRSDGAQVRFTHILQEFPLRPLVEGHLIKKSIIEAYAQSIPSKEKRLIVEEANAFRLEADPGTPYTIRLYKAVSNNSSDFDFWMDVFDYARLQGPRMLAALLLVVPDDLWKDRAKKDREHLLNTLRNFH